MTRVSTPEMEHAPSVEEDKPQGSWEGIAAPITVMILTLNEEVNIVDCLASCAWCDDVHVIDSGSTDRTRELAEACGARVHVNKFVTHGIQHNWAIEQVECKHDWRFHLDADERFTPEQVREMAAALANDPVEAGFYVPSKLMFLDRWLKYSGGYPTYQMRFFHKDRMRYCDYGHAQREKTDGLITKLREPYIHYSFSKGIDDWFEKHNRYSAREALEAFGARQSVWKSFMDMFYLDRVVRRRAIKSIGYRLPFRAVLVRLYMLFIQRGLLDGRAGLVFIALRTTYEHMIDAKFAALRCQKIKK